MRRSSLVKTGDRKFSQVAAFSPALAHWELAQHSPDELAEPGAFDFESALLFVDIRCCRVLHRGCLQPSLAREAAATRPL